MLFQIATCTYLAGENAEGIATRWECNRAGYRQANLWSPGWWSAGGCAPVGHRIPEETKQHSQSQKRLARLVKKQGSICAARGRWVAA